MPIEFSDEQISIGNSLRSGRNILIDAVAGSGKTTTIAHMAEVAFPRELLALLYNKNLASESRKKIKTSNLDILTIHSCAQKIYKIQCDTDYGLFDILENNLDPREKKSYSAVIIDEAQDLYGVMYLFLLKLIRDLNIPQIILMGDYRQCIYQFRGSHIKYLVEAPRFFSNDRSWERHHLSQSYRCTIPMVNLANSLQGRIFMKGIRKGPKPLYLLCNAFKIGNYLIKKIKEWLKMGFKEEDIAVIAPSLRSRKSPVYRFANILTGQGYKIFKGQDEESDHSHEIQKGKIIFSSIHQFKGQERKIIILFGFDNSFYKYYSSGLSENEDRLPNRIYVGITRANSILVLIHHFRNDFFKFIKRNDLPKLCEIICLQPLFLSGMPLRDHKISLSLSELIRFLPSSLVRKISNLYTIVKIKDGKNASYFNPIEDVGGSKENVISIYECAIPMIKMAELNLDPILRLFEETIFPQVNEMIEEESLIDLLQLNLDKLSSILQRKERSFQDYAFVANFANSVSKDYLYLLNQVKDYTWFEEKTSWILEAIENLNFLRAEDLFNIKISCGYVFENKEIEIFGMADCCSSQGELWRFKYCNSLREDHILEFSLLAAMGKLTNASSRYFLLNMFNAELLELIFETTDDAIALISLVMQSWIRKR